MKTSKKNMVKIALLAVVFAIAFVGCDNGSTKKCDITNHAIDDDLSCGHSAKIYGYVNLDGGSKIPIYRMSGVTDAEMVTSVAKAIAGYALLTQLQKDDLVDKIDEIRITPISASSSYTYTTINGKKVVAYKHNRPDTGVQSLFINIGDGTITLAQVQPNDGIRLAGQTVKAACYPV